MKALFKSQFPFVELEDSKLTDKQKEIKAQYVELYKDKEFNLNFDPEWLLAQFKLADQIIMRYNKNNAVSSWLVAKTNSFYINDGQVNILDGIAQNSVTDIKEVKLYGI